MEDLFHSSNYIELASTIWIWKKNTCWKFGLLINSVWGKEPKYFPSSAFWSSIGKFWHKGDNAFHNFICGCIQDRAHILSVNSIHFGVLRTVMCGVWKDKKRTVLHTNVWLVLVDILSCRSIFYRLLYDIFVTKSKEQTQFAFIRTKRTERKRKKYSIGCP